jgi:hypothetical protein
MRDRERRGPLYCNRAYRAGGRRVERAVVGDEGGFRFKA